MCVRVCMYVCKGETDMGLGKGDIMGRGKDEVRREKSEILGGMEVGRERG